MDENRTTADVPSGPTSRPTSGLPSGPASGLPPGPASGATFDGPTSTGTPPPRTAYPRDPRFWLLLGVVAVLLLCCGAAAVVTAVGLAWYGHRHPLDHHGRTVRLGQPVRDGDLEFRVRAVECGAATIGGSTLNRAAAGQFCLVRLTVRNLDDAPVTFVDTWQHAYGPDGRRFGPDRGAGLLANADKPVFPDRVAPGQRLAWAIVYDVPRNSRIVRLRLRHTAGSPGAEVHTG